MADFQTQFKPASPEPICSSWIFILTLLFKQLVDMNEFLVMCAYVCELYAGECAGCLEKKSWHFTIICTHTHPKQILPIYTACCLFVHRDTRPHGVTCRRHNIHVFCLSVRKKSHSSEIHQINVLMSQENTLYFHVHVKKITVCS